MPTRPDQPDPSGASPGANAFSGLGAGLGFFQDWMKAASSALPNLGGAATSGAPAWSMPTLDPEELDKRIQDLKTVQFWLEQNARMIGMTIQTLEVQRMTLNTLREMKVPVDVLRETLKAQAQPGQAPGEPSPKSESEASSTTSATPGVNPMSWWGTLTEQFTTLASQAVQAGQEAMSAAAPVAKAAADATVPPKAASPAQARPKAAGKTVASRQKTNGAPADDAPSATPRRTPRR